MPDPIRRLGDSDLYPGADGLQLGPRISGPRHRLDQQLSGVERRGGWEGGRCPGRGGRGEERGDFQDGLRTLLHDRKTQKIEHFEIAYGTM